MKKLIHFLLPLVVILALAGFTATAAPSPAPATAAGPGTDTDLSAILARSAVKGYLTSLRYSTATQNALSTFYLTPEVASGEVALALAKLQPTDYTISAENWLNDTTYQITALLPDANKTVVADASKVSQRWQIVALAWGDGATSSATATTTVTTTATSATGQAIAAPATGVTAKVVSPALNVRSGPGTAYPAKSTLTQGDVVDVIGVSGLGTWYQVAQKGTLLGWIGAGPAYVSVSGNAENLPVISAPALSGSASTSAGGNSGVGKLILQTSSGGDMYLVNADFSPLADGTQAKRLTSGIDPAFSPDGSKIAFTRWGSGDVGSVWVYDLATGAERSVSEQMSRPKAPTWSADGSEVVIGYQNGGRLQIEYKCQDPDRNIPQGAYDFKLKNGQLCFYMPVDLHWSLRRVNINTGAQTDLPSDRYSYAPTWDPANAWRVVFAGSNGLGQLDLNRNEYFAFTKDLRDRGPIFSPDGRKVALSYRQHLTWDIYTIDTQTAQRTRLTAPTLLEDNYSSAAPAWSPDSKQIAFVTNRTGQWEFWVMNADGSNQRPLLPANLAKQIPVTYNQVDERLISWSK